MYRFIYSSVHFFSFVVSVIALFVGYSTFGLLSFFISVSPLFLYVSVEITGKYLFLYFLKLNLAKLCTPLVTSAYMQIRRN